MHWRLRVHSSWQTRVVLQVPGCPRMVACPHLRGVVVMGGLLLLMMQTTSHGLAGEVLVIR